MMHPAENEAGRVRSITRSRATKGLSSLSEKTNKRRRILLAAGRHRLQMMPHTDRRSAAPPRRRRRLGRRRGGRRNEKSRSRRPPSSGAMSSRTRPRAWRARRSRSTKRVLWSPTPGRRRTSAMAVCCGPRRRLARRRPRAPCRALFALFRRWPRRGRTTRSSDAQQKRRRGWAMASIASRADGARRRKVVLRRPLFIRLPWCLPRNSRYL